MTCAEFVSAIDAYLDDELSIAEILRMHGHMISCERCHRVMASEATLHALITNDAALDRSPESLRAHILRRAVAEDIDDGSRPPGPRSRPGALASFSALLVAALLVGLFLLVSRFPGRTDSADLAPLAAEVAAKHLLYSSTLESALEVRTSDASEMALYLERRTGMAVNVLQLRDADGRLIGGRLSSLADDPAVYLLYEWRGRRVSLFVTRSAPSASRAGSEKAIDDVELHTATLRGVVTALWEEEDEGRLYAAALIGEPAVLREFAYLCLRKEQAPKPG